VLTAPEDEASIDLRTLVSLSFEWTDVADISCYSLMLSLSPDMSSAQAIATTGNPYLLTKADLDTKLKALGLDQNVSTKIYWSVYPCDPALAFSKQVRSVNITRSKNKFEPEDGKCFVFIGQDLGAIGGIEGYDQGYCNTFETPAGVTVYFGIGNGGDISGLHVLGNWGSGDCWADKYPKTARFNNSMIAIGLPIVGDEQKIINGSMNNGLTRVGEWIKSLAPRPVFLRIGYEFDGYDWNFYVPETYVSAYRYIKNYFDTIHVTNIAYVWQSKGYGLSVYDHNKWYPGDDYVDWCAYSHFGNPDGNMIKFARSKGKPVFIAESTPVFQQGNTFLDADIKKPEIAKKIWDEWFTSFFRTIEENSDVVKAFSYINVDWYAQSMWKDNVTFQQCDSRIQKSDYVSGHWQVKMAESKYINAAGFNWNDLPH
jgi:hypothetical protein